MQWYSATSRDSVRISDMKSMQVWLELYHLQVWRYPEPTGWSDITYSWWVVWTQWTFWDSVITNISKLNEKPTDPLNGVEYTYSLLDSKQEFQLAWAMEWDTIVLNNWVNQTNAASRGKRWRAYIDWNYNWRVSRSRSWWRNYILALPTIISSDISVLTVENIVTNKKLVYKWKENLPASYTWTTFEVSWEEDLTLVDVANIEVFSWLNLPSTTEEIKTLMTNLKTAYTWTDLSTDWNYQNIINLDTNDASAVSALWTDLVNNDLWLELVVEEETEPDTSCDTWFVHDWTSCVAATDENSFTFNSGIWEITWYSGPSDVVIPSSIGWIPVISIWEYAFEGFEGDDLTSVVIPNSVTSILYRAFDGNSLTSITIPNNSISIWNYAFYGQAWNLDGYVYWPTTNWTVYTIWDLDQNFIFDKADFPNYVSNQ